MPRNKFSEQEALNLVFNEKKISALQFGLISPDLIEKLSVAEVKSTQIYDMTTFQPNYHAVNDPRMGVCDKDALCKTCNGT